MNLALLRKVSINTTCVQLVYNFYVLFIIYSSLLLSFVDADVTCDCFRLLLELLE